MSTVDLNPDALCTDLDEMGWLELDDVYRAVLSALELTVEAPGAQRREKGMDVAQGKPGSSTPRAAPLCLCGCPSQRDHWQGILDAAADRDLRRDSEPRDFRNALFRAAEDLHNTRHPARYVDRDGKPEASGSGDERSRVIVERYVGMPADRAAVYETRRAGTISGEALRRTRRRLGYGMELGFPRLPDEQLADAVMAERREGRSEREIARRLDVGRTVVANILRANEQLAAA